MHGNNEQFHGWHHRLYVPYAFGSLYSHPLEGFLLDTLGAVIAEWATGLSTQQAMPLFSVSSLKTLDDHYGSHGTRYRCLGGTMRIIMISTIRWAGFVFVGLPQLIIQIISNWNQVVSFTSIFRALGCVVGDADRRGRISKARLPACSCPSWVVGLAWFSRVPSALSKDMEEEQEEQKKVHWKEHARERERERRQSPKFWLVEFKVIRIGCTADSCSL